MYSNFIELILTCEIMMTDNNALLPNANWQTKQRGSNDSEYQIYRDCAGDANGIDTITGKPLKSYDEWLNS